MAGLRPYPAYRDSGVAWLREVPVGWEVRRNARIFSRRVAAGDLSLPVLEVSLKTGVRIRDLESSGRKQVIDDRQLYRRASRGDIAYNTMRMWQGAVGVVPVDGLVSPAYVVVRPFPEADAHYFEYLFRTAAYMREAEKYSRGIVSDRNRLYWEDFKRIPSPFPPLEEQAAIAHYLRHIDRRIRRYIRAKRRLIALLEEHKRAIIQRAVTRGLDPNVRLKPSGVEWLGQVPEHWDVVAVGTRYSVELGKMLDRKRITGEHLVPYLRNADVQWDRVNTADLPMMDILPAEYGRYTLQCGDLLVCEGGEVGRAAFWNAELPMCGFQKALHRVRVRDSSRDNARFLYYLLWMAARSGVFRADGNENTIAHLTAEKLRRHRLPFPPPREQDALVGHLDVQVDRIDRALVRTRQEIDLLREYRARLIADVVTGKLDVRAAAAELPDEAGESEAFEIAGELDSDHVAPVAVAEPAPAAAES